MTIMTSEIQQNSTIEEALTNIENLILLSLDAKSNLIHRNHDFIKKGDLEFVGKDAGTLLHIDEMKPSSYFSIVLDRGDEHSGRLFAGNKEYLVAPAFEIFGSEAEVSLMTENSMKWFGFRRINKLPKNVSVLGKPVALYEMHFRNIFLNGTEEYCHRIISFDRLGNVLPMKIGGYHLSSSLAEGSSAIICASVIEDSFRANTMLASIKEGVELKFPVPMGEYKEIFSQREAPMTPSGRRKAIIHWVAKHLRRTKHSAPSEINRHLRGVRTIVVEGITISLTPQEGNQYVRFLK